MKLSLILLPLLISPAWSQTAQDHWVATWTTAQPLIRVQAGGRGAAPPPPAATAPAPAPVSPQQRIMAQGFQNQTIRMIVHTSIGGSRMRIRLSSPFGSEPVEVGSAHVALRTKEGDLTAAPAIADATSAPAYYWLEAVDVVAPARTSLIVAFGDSITEGARSTPDTNHTWPAELSARLAANRSTANVAVANMGIGGNRVLRDIAGASALARFDRDVLSQPGVKWVMMLEGINDIGRGNIEPASADDLIGAYKQIIERAHAHGIRVIGCTLTPYEGANYAREEGEAIREAVNTWIRTGRAFDGVVDFEAATRDPNNPKRIRADFDPGDHLHPNDAGYEAMANSVDLSMFTEKTGAAGK
jgi:lysophospholipase L1-like esterase